MTVFEDIPTEDLRYLKLYFGLCTCLTGETLTIVQMFPAKLGQFCPSDPTNESKGGRGARRLVGELEASSASSPTASAAREGDAGTRAGG